MEMGGLSAASKWRGSGGKSNDMAVEKPTRVRAAKSSVGQYADTP